ncbi:hypothetical protein BU26DRAFT_514651 [Trematosphaeria pertusa]|uniref:Uncharacterized protein n=1 Tax=Trematosphaeria pertusa TaxID=390896 RepID=A0A6A6IWZ1_9PLEO|nr:uncharacterized protein BU26DRAFT_514651 [Trematosphaeria pertusa]KAF2254808.1 hypothetical protein BU26DRAFT_514651 [Trematosphaeria pertusa]
MSSATAFDPPQSSPLARTTSPFKDTRPSPCPPAETAKLWDEYEKRAVDNARRRETTCPSSPSVASQSGRFSSTTVLDIIKSYDPLSSPRIPCPSPSIGASPHFDFGFTKQTFDSAASTTVAICKTCKRSITSLSGICEKCKKTIIFPSTAGETTPPLSPAARNFASTDLPQLHKNCSSGTTTPSSSPPKRKARRQPSSTQLIDPPIRLSSLRPPPPLQDTPRSSTEAPRPRKASLTPDLSEPFARLQLSRKPLPLPPAAYPATPPSTSHSHHSSSAPRTRPSSLANITTPPPSTNYSRHNSATPSELSTLYPYISSSSTTTSPPSVCRASYRLQNTTSAWDDWDSEDEEEKAGLVGYWRARKWRGSRGSLGGQSAAKVERRESGGAKEEGGRKRPRGFVRVISCGCSED